MLKGESVKLNLYKFGSFVLSLAGHRTRVESSQAAKPQDHSDDKKPIYHHLYTFTTLTP